jgi:hypothetical protein
MLARASQPAPTMEEREKLHEKIHADFRLEITARKTAELYLKMLDGVNR